MDADLNKFLELCELEPELRVLASDLFKVLDKKTEQSFYANRIWYSQFKPRLKVLVGWNAGLIHDATEIPKTKSSSGFLIMRMSDILNTKPKKFMAQVDPKLKTQDAYDVAYQFLYACLPPCRNCSCF